MNGSNKFATRISVLASRALCADEGSRAHWPLLPSSPCLPCPMLDHWWLSATDLVKDSLTGNRSPCVWEPPESVTGRTWLESSEVAFADPVLLILTRFFFFFFLSHRRGSCEKGGRKQSGECFHWEGGRTCFIHRFICLAEEWDGNDTFLENRRQDRT